MSNWGAMNKWGAVLVAVLASLCGFAQVGGETCNDMAPICTDSGVQFTANADGPNALISEPGNNYSCLGGAPNPSWYFLEIAESGDIIMSLSAPQDIDFIIWGPYPNLAAAQANCGSHSNVVPDVGGFLCELFGLDCTSYGCSFDPTANETPGIPNAQAGQVYVMLIANFANTVQNISLVQTGGTGATDCTILEPCVMTEISADVSACDGDTYTYTTTGFVTYEEAPETGQLIIEDCNGIQQAFNPPFTGLNEFSLENQPADGQACDLFAFFTDAPGCTIDVGGYTAPECECVITNFEVNVETCDPATNTFSVGGTVDFDSPPLSGTLTITTCQGQTLTFNAPFTGPIDYTIPGLAANGAACNVTVSFSASASCTSNINFTSPNGCDCVVDAGNFEVTSPGEGGLVGNTFVLCQNDLVNIASTGGFVPAANLNDPEFNYDPGLWLLLYDCPPTVFPQQDILDDPCFAGVYSSADGNWDVINEEANGETFYVVPITMYDMGNSYYSVSNTESLCYDLGPVYTITLLTPIVATDEFDCQAGTASFTISGGMPAFDNSQFTVSNLLPANASFANTSVNNGGVILIEGLEDGQTYSFTVTDELGCSVELSGGPFIAAQAPEIEAVEVLCVSDDPVQLSANVADGQWSATCGNCVSPSGVFNMEIAGAGVHVVTYETPGECGGVSSLEIEVTDFIIPELDPLEALCVEDDLVEVIGLPAGGQWSASCGNCVSPNGVFNPSASGAGLHELTYTLQGACAGASSIEVEVLPLADASFAAAGPFCTTDDAVALDATLEGGLWSASCGACIDPVSGVFDPATAGMGEFTITYTIEGFCGNSESGVISVTGVPDATITPAGPFCENDDAFTFEAASSGGVWTADCGNCMSPSGVFSPELAGAGEFSIVYTVDFPCLATSSTLVEVIPQPNVLFTVDDPDGCVPHPVVFSTEVSDDVVDCTWAFGTGGSMNSCGETAFVYNTPGCYDVSLTVVSENGCVSVVAVDDMVCAWDYPQSTFVSSPARPTFDEPWVVLSEIAFGAATYEWLIDGEVVGTEPQLTYNLNLYGGSSVPVCLRVTNIHGCEDTFCRTLELSESLTIFVPNAFTPDQDGVNEVWLPVVTGAMEYECSVYNRWGERVFYSETPGEAWLGEVQQGEYFSPDGVYTWHIKVVGVDFETKDMKGHVIIMR